MKTIWSIATLPLRAAIILASLLDALFKPVYRPVIAAVASLSIFEKLEAKIAAMPRFYILLSLAFPFAIAEPMKILGLIVIAHAHLVSGIAMVVLAHLVTFLLVERIYHAGRDKLLTYTWFAWIMRYVRYARSFYDRVKASAQNWMRLRGLAG